MRLIQRMNLLTFALPTRRKGASYSRSSFWAVTDTEDVNRINDTIFHESAHFWWHGATATTWEDWLNESFAEYFSWVINDTLGRQPIEEYIASLSTSIDALPDIYQLERDNPLAYQVLYIKGAVIVHRLKQRMGQEDFIRFSKAILQLDGRKTDAVIALLAADFGTQHALWLQSQLGIPNTLDKHENKPSH